MKVIVINSYLILLIYNKTEYISYKLEKKMIISIIEGCQRALMTDEVEKRERSILQVF